MLLSSPAKASAMLLAEIVSSRVQGLVPCPTVISTPCGAMVLKNDWSRLVCC